MLIAKYKMVSDFGMILLILMPLHNHSPFYFAHHNVRNVELNIWHTDFLFGPLRFLLLKLWRILNVAVDYLLQDRFEGTVPVQT